MKVKIFMDCGRSIDYESKKTVKQEAECILSKDFYMPGVNETTIVIPRAKISFIEFTQVQEDKQTR